MLDTHNVQTVNCTMFGTIIAATLTLIVNCTF